MTRDHREFVSSQGARFVVPLLLSWDDKAGVSRAEYLTGFIANHKNRLLWVTAGHVLKLIRELQWDLDLSIDARWAFGESPDGTKCDLKSIQVLNPLPGDPDMGVAVIGPGVAGRVLADPQLEPINSGHWESEEAFKPDYAYILGCPREFTEQARSHTAQGTGFGVAGRLIAIPVTEPVDSPYGPPSDRISKLPPIYVGISTETPPGSEPLKTINGMSGGPLVVVGRRHRRALALKVIGVQSRWYPDKRIALVEPLEALMRTVDQIPDH